MNKKYPHVPAAFINAIAEEGTKEEAVKYLQEQWNETCVVKYRLNALMRVISVVKKNAEFDGSEGITIPDVFLHRLFEVYDYILTADRRPNKNVFPG